MIDFVIATVFVSGIAPLVTYLCVKAGTRAYCSAMSEFIRRECGVVRKAAMEATRE